MTDKINYIAFDTETDPISYHDPVPDVICMSMANVGEPKGHLLVPWECPIDQRLHGIWDKGDHTVGHNVAFDLSVMAFKYPHLLPRIFDALDKGLIHDTLLREKLLNITLHGSLEMLEVNGSSVRMNYALVDLEKKYLNIDRSALKDDTDAPRTNYNVVKGKPTYQWPEEFVSYAIDDAVNTGLVFEKQEIERTRCINTTGYDPFETEAFRVRAAFALRLIECTGSMLDGEMVEKVAEEFRREYNKPELREPLIAAGLLVPEQPPQPYANGAIEHLETCRYFGAKVTKKKLAESPCSCPPKMKAAEPEVSPTKPLFRYIWSLARTKPDLIKAWLSEGCASKLRQAGVYDQIVANGAVKREILEANPELPDDITLSTDAEWAANFSALDPLLTVWNERKNLRKIVTDYLPKLYYADPNTGQEAPAAIIRGGFNPLVLTGRSSSFASKLYPSRNEQNVDPRVRPCTIPRPGNVIISTDYAGMELGTLAQKCINLFGFSELGNKINAGIDTHAFLAAQIAYNMDADFMEMVKAADMGGSADDIFSVFKAAKGLKESCESELPAFTAVYRHEHPELESGKKVTWADFFKHYRTMAKPTGLGYPGGLGAATFISYAKATFGLKLDLETAKQLKELWLSTYPEMGPYLENVSKNCIDPHHSKEEYEDDDGNIKERVYYCYDTPRGMHRGRCGFCEAANGMGLQAFSAEGALEALYRVIRQVWLAEPGSILDGVYIINFIHDEILWESPDDNWKGQRARLIEQIMIDAMEEITPNVKAGAESAAMRRWNKKAESIWKKVKDASGNEQELLEVWEPEEK